MNFKIENYTNICTDLIHDIFYSDISTRGRISSIRQYTEIIVRKCLDLTEDTHFTLGDKKHIGDLFDDSLNNDLFKDALKKIKKLGNKYTHTKYIGTVTKEDEEKSFEALVNMSSYLFVQYFNIYEFGSNTEILNYFSYLPPIIRFKVLNNLFNNGNKENRDIIDKLILSILKNEGKDKALAWINENEEMLRKTLASSEEIRQNRNSDLMKFIPDYILSRSMYEVCLEKVELVGEAIEKNGSMYKSFEEAISHFKEREKLSEDTPENIEFNNLIALLYLGRVDDKIAYTP